jgi:hypothetical protein
MSEQERNPQTRPKKKEETKRRNERNPLYIQRQVDFVVSDFCFGETGGQ